MPAIPLRPVRLETSPLVIAVAGALSLAAAMGIGRFAFTPLMPMMLHEGLIDINTGSLLATANYIGYLLGALICMALPALLGRAGLRPPANATMVRFGLVATVVLTLAMALDLPGIWATLRLLSGIISAFVFVYTSAWCLKRLADRNALSMGGFIYTGPGVGIALSGALAFVLSSSGRSAAAGWIAFGLLAALLALSVWAIFRPDPRTHQATASPLHPRAAHVAARWTLEHAILVIAYGIAGFGYIITATFLPVIARETLAGSFWIELFWPVFGIGVAAGAALTRLLPSGIDRRTLMIACYVIQAFGILITLRRPTVVGFMLGSALVGLPFTVISLLGMQEARRLRPADPTSFMALMTASYGLGQIAGPPLVSAILSHSASHAAGFSVSLWVAAGTLAFGACLYAFSRWRYPLASI